MPNNLIKQNLLKLIISLFFQASLAPFCVANDHLTSGRSILIDDATAWLEETLNARSTTFEIIPPDHRVKILSCKEKLKFDFPFNGKQTIRAKCNRPTWQFFLRVETDDPHTKKLLRPTKYTKKKETVNPIEEVLIARKNLISGSILEKTDTELKTVKKKSLPVDFYNTFDGLENYEVVKPIKAGAVIRAINLRPARLIKRGTIVQLKILAQGMLVTASVEALEDGHLGQQIKLLNSSSGKTVIGIVTGLNEVSGL